MQAPEGKEEVVPVNCDVVTIDGLTAHAGRNELLSFVNMLSPMPHRIIVQHGELSRSLDLASTLYKLHKIETNVPRNLETLRLR
jgi:predicted metal-dependent RNase